MIIHIFKYHKGSAKGKHPRGWSHYAYHCTICKIEVLFEHIHTHTNCDPKVAKALASARYQERLQQKAKTGKATVKASGKDKLVKKAPKKTIISQNV